MRVQTDLNGVKTTAKMLLMTKINKIRFSPAIVQHPFTSSGFVLLPENGETRMADITKSSKDMQIWQNRMMNEIYAKQSASAIYFLLNEPYRLTFLKFAQEYLSQEDFSVMLADAWISTENPNMYPDLTRNELVAMFKAADSAELMSKDEQDMLNRLDEEVTVYRGVTPYNEKSIRALSWTLDYEKAKWFAQRFGESGTVYEAQIKKEHILAYFDGRGESEVIVEPKYLTGIAQAQEPKEEMKIAQ